MVKDVNVSLNEIIEKLKLVLLLTSDDVFLDKVRQKIKKDGEIEFTNYKKIERNPMLITSVFNQEEKYQKIYKILKTIEDIDDKKLKVCDYFTEQEIKNYKNVVFEKFDESNYHVFKDVFKKSENQFSFLLSVEDIAILSKHFMIRVDSNYQRQSKLKVNKETNEVLKQIYVNSTRVQEIANLLVSNNYYFDEIKLNLINETGSVLRYMENEKSLYWEGDIVVPDGNHRRLACIKAYCENPELRQQFKNQKFNVSFSYLTPRELKELINQTWNTEPIAKRHKQAMVVNKSTDVIEEMLRNNNIEDLLRKNIVTTGNDLGLGKSVFIKSYMSEAINAVYKANKFSLNSQVKQLSDWLVEFMNYIVELWVDDFQDVLKTKRNTWKFSFIIIFGLFELSRLCKNKLEKDNAYDWKQDVKNILNSIDFSKESAIVRADSVSSGRKIYTVSDKKVMIKYFNERFNENDV